MYFVFQSVPYSPSFEESFNTKKDLITFLEKEYNSPENIQEALENGSLRILKGSQIENLKIKKKEVIKEWDI